MARIEGVREDDTGLFARIAYWFSRRRMGRVVEPLTVLAHHGPMLAGAGAFELALEQARRVDGRLKSLASLKAAALVGCPF
jgi:hypothetical protein